MSISSGGFPSVFGIMCAALTVAIPMSVNFINKKLHEKGDPDWKRDSER